MLRSAPHMHVDDQTCMESIVNPVLMLTEKLLTGGNSRYRSNRMNNQNRFATHLSRVVPSDESMTPFVKVKLPKRTPSDSRIRTRRSPCHGIKVAWMMRRS